MSGPLPWDCFAGWRPGGKAKRERVYVGDKLYLRCAICGVLRLATEGFKWLKPTKTRKKALWDSYCHGCRQTMNREAQRKRKRRRNAD